MASKFKTGDYWLLDNNYILEIHKLSGHRDYILVKFMDNDRTSLVDFKWLKARAFKCLGNNAEVVQLLYK